ncbi:UNVERIFIED_CONTAM: Serine carboxypeptidase-like 18 [Sesamum indicum]
MLDYANSKGGSVALKLNEYAWTKWLIDHPKYLENPLYIFGESYSGIVLPLVVNEVYNGIETGDKPVLNMKCLDRIAKAQILDPWCEDSLAKKQDVLSWYMSFEENSINFLQSVVVAGKKEWCREDNVRLAHTWANDKYAQKALNIREGTIKQWVRCNQSIANSTPGPSGIIPYINNVKRTVGYHQKFTHKSARVLIFSGDHDMMAPHISTEKWIESLKVPIKSDWRPWFVGNQIGGYTMQYAQGDYELTYATIKVELGRPSKQMELFARCYKKKADGCWSSLRTTKMAKTFQKLMEDHQPQSTRGPRYLDQIRGFGGYDRATAVTSCSREQ